MKLALYRMATSLGGPLIRLYLRQRVKRGKEDPARIDERLGRASLPRPAGKLVWLHGASVGEAMSMLPLIERLRTDHPGWAVLVTTGTVTSAKLMAERLPQGVMHQYVPVDRIPYVRRFIEHWKPDLALWLESEFWPNLVVETRASAVPMVVLNGRMSEKSFEGWKKNRPMITQLLKAFRLVLAQSDLDAQRFRDLGAKDVATPGNIKFASPPLPADADATAELNAWLDDRPRWLAASTHAGEEAIAAGVHARLKAHMPELLTLIAPRHPERGQAIEAELRAKGLNVARRSLSDVITPATDVYIADTIGELGLFYRAAEVVFIGKTFAGGGGQNPIEAAQLDCALVFGPDMSNFAAVAQTLRDADGAREVADETQLGDAVLRLLDEPDTRGHMANAAKDVARAEAGVLDRVMAALEPYFKNGESDARA